MKLLWQIENSDIQKVLEFYNEHKDNCLVKNRIERNVEGNIPDFSKEIFWHKMISCLLTTQQRSGPNSPVKRFIYTKPFPLAYDKCKSRDNLKRFVEKTITDFGRIRWGNKIGEEVKNNFLWLEKEGGWGSIKNMFAELKANNSKKIEREWAEFLANKDSNRKKRLKGFGPKQSRNLLQSLGLTKYEIPIDSRIIKRLKEFGFPIELSASALADKNYYNFILEGIQKICDAIGIYPCLLDAAIFASFDEE